MNAQGAQWDCKCIPANLQGDQRGCISLERDQESSGIELVYACVYVQGVKADLGAGLFFYIPYSTCYILKFTFYICYIF